MVLLPSTGRVSHKVPFALDTTVTSLTLTLTHTFGTGCVTRARTNHPINMPIEARNAVVRKVQHQNGFPNNSRSNLLILQLSCRLVFYPSFTQLSTGKKFLTSFNLVAAIKELQLGFKQNCGGEVSPVQEGGGTESSGKSLIFLPKQ